MSDNLGLVDFAIELVNFELNLPDRQVKFFEEFKASSTLNLVVRNPEFLSKKFSLQLKNNRAFNVFNHIITLVYYFWIKPKTELVKKQMNEMTGSGIAKLKGIFKATVSNLYFF